MKITHYELSFELDDDWWTEAEMSGFVPKSKAYSVAPQGSREIHEVRIEDVGPVLRDPIFRDSVEEGSAHDRVVRILRGFRSRDAIPPVEIAKNQSNYGHSYKLVHGAHRFYCSLAAGFTHVPAVQGFDWDTR